MSNNYASMKAADLRQILVKECGYSQEEADAVKGKTDLTYEVMKARGELQEVDVEEVLDDIDFETMEVEADKVYDVEQDDGEEVIEPPYGSVAWQEYVLSLMREDELLDGYPTCAGLRRVAEILLGEVTFSGPTQVFPANDPNGPGRATVLYSVTFAWKRDVPAYIDLDKFEYPVRTFADVADCWHGNTPDTFAVHPVATASTRAEGRALRKALKLNIHTAEEMANDKDASEVVLRSQERELGRQTENWNPTNNITPVQKKFILTKCKQLGIDVEKFINIEYYCYNTDEHLAAPKYSNIDEVTSDVAKKMIEEINRYQTNTGTDESTDIPDVIKLKG